MELALQQPGDTSLRWTSIIIDVLKPIASGHPFFSPTPLERSILNSYILDCQRLHMLLSDIEAAIPTGSRANPESSWTLRRARIILRERINRCNVATAPGPIRRLPPEIISEIFYHCLPLLCRPDPSTAPLLLCRISSLWRDIAQTTWRLWSRLDFTCQQKPSLKEFLQPSPPYWRSVAPIHQWISRSRKSHLYLSFHHSNNDNLPALVSKVLLPSTADLLHLEICLPLRTSSTPFQPFFALPPHTLESLKYLILAQGLPGVQATAFRASPNLTHLSLDDLGTVVLPYESGDIPRLHPTFPWPRITHLVITRCITPEVWVAALSTCRSLEVGQFFINMQGDSSYETLTSSESEDSDEYHVCGNRRMPTMEESVVLPFLRELDIIIGCGQSLPLQGFYFPSLKAFRFHRGHMPHISARQQRRADSLPDRFSWKSSLSLLSSPEHLNVLSLAGRVGSVEEIMVLLRHVPTIEVLDINLKVNHQALLTALIFVRHTQPPTMPIPRLSYLRWMLHPDDVPSFSRSAFMGVALSRFHTPPNVPAPGSITLVSNTFRKEHLDFVESVVGNTNLYVRTDFDVDVDSSRVVPWKRCTPSWEP